MIDIQHLTKYYSSSFGKHYVFRDQSLTMKLDRNVGFLGCNGAGKSTLIRLLSGVEKPDMGRIICTDRLSWPLGFSGGIHKDLTGEENVRFIAKLYHQHVPSILKFTYDFAELGKFFYMPVRTYSSGMKAKLSFGLSMAIDFDVYLIDEVMGVGDAKFRKKCHEVFSLKRKSARMILVSHNIETVKKWCKDIILIKDGKLRQMKNMDEAIKIYEAQ